MERLRSRGPILGVYTLCALALAAVAGCGGGGSASSASAQNATSPPPPVSGSANLVWVTPTTNTDGTALTNLAGFTIEYGNSPGAMTQTIDVPSAGAAGAYGSGLTAGTWYFTVKAYTNVGTRSAASDVASKTIS